MQPVFKHAKSVQDSGQLGIRYAHRLMRYPGAVYVHGVLGDCGVPSGTICASPPANLCFRHDQTFTIFLIVFYSRLFIGDLFS